MIEQDRQYQDQIVTVATAGYEAGESMCIGMATGLGKTHCFTRVAENVAGKGHRTLALGPKREIVGQISKRMGQMGMAHGLINADTPTDYDPLTGPLTHVASIDTVRARLERLRPYLSQVGLAIFDEAHHIAADSWRMIADAMPNAVRLGATATPYRLDGKPLGTLFKHAIRGPSYKQAFADGYLVPPHLYAPKTPDLRGVQKVAGDFNRKRLREVVDFEELARLAAIAYAQHAPGKRALVPCSSVADAIMAAEHFRSVGWRTACVHGGMSDAERDDALNGLTEGRYQVLTCCDLVSEGVDIPALEVIILLRPTASTALYVQIVGRALRPAPGKTRALIIDMVGNWTRHGLVEQERQWSLEVGVTGLERQVGALRRCGRCHRVMELEVGTTRCPSCGRRFPRLGPKHSAAQLAVMPDVRGVPAEEVAAMHWDDLIALPRSREDLQVIARIRGYRADWVTKMAERLEVAA